MSVEVKRHGMAAGFDGVLVKPADLDNIVAVIVGLTNVAGTAGQGSGRGDEGSVRGFGYSRAPMIQGRMDKTVDKMRRGGLPAPTKHNRVLALGDGRPCDGCGETIHPTEVQSAILLRGLDWRLHDYAAWSTFTR